MRPSKKLDYKFEGPFKVVKVVNNRSYRLELPPNIKMHNVFYSSLLYRVADDPLDG